MIYKAPKSQKESGHINVFFPTILWRTGLHELARTQIAHYGKHFLPHSSTYFS